MKNRQQSIPFPKEIAEKLRASSKRMLENLLMAQKVKPDNLSEEQNEELNQAIAKAETLFEKMSALADKLEEKSKT